mgnify:CR=1 FL=1
MNLLFKPKNGYVHLVDYSDFEVHTACGKTYFTANGEFIDKQRFIHDVTCKRCIEEFIQRFNIQLKILEGKEAREN